MAEDFPNLKKKKRYPGTGNTDSSKQDEPEQIENKTQHN